MSEKKGYTLTKEQFDGVMDYINLLNQVIPCTEHGKYDCVNCKSMLIRQIKVTKPEQKTKKKN